MCNGCFRVSVGEVSLNGTTHVIRLYSRFCMGKNAAFESSRRHIRDYQTRIIEIVPTLVPQSGVNEQKSLRLHVLNHAFAAVIGDQDQET